jgi:hypothetical protein
MSFSDIRNFFIVIWFLALSAWGAGQSMNQNLVKYTPEYEFKDGIYPNFLSVKNSHPIPKTRLVTTVDLFSRDFFEQVTEEKRIVFYDDNGVQQELKTSNTWGYARNGVLYINLGSNFHRISFIGSIGHFVATLTTYNQGYYDPYYRSNYNNRYNSPSSSYASTEVKQYLIDFETGKLHEFDIYSVEILLMKDPELHDEFMELRRKKKKQYKFVYIRKFNEKHPLYFPKK